MRFIVDEEAKKTLVGLCDLALKSGGTQNLAIVNSIQANTEDYKETEKKKAK